MRYIIIKYNRYILLYFFDIYIYIYIYFVYIYSIRALNRGQYPYK